MPRDTGKAGLVREFMQSDYKVHDTKEVAKVLEDSGVAANSKGARYASIVLSNLARDGWLERVDVAKYRALKKRGPVAEAQKQHIKRDTEMTKKARIRERDRKRKAAARARQKSSEGHINAAIGLQDRLAQCADILFPQGLPPGDLLMWAEFTKGIMNGQR